MRLGLLELGVRFSSPPLQHGQLLIGVLIFALAMLEIRVNEFSTLEQVDVTFILGNLFQQSLALNGQLLIRLRDARG
ncbi:hypothetical protein D3C78_1804050 [compost metagenome]